VALSFVSDKDSALLQQVQVDQEDEGRTIQPYEFKMAIVEGFRYRVEDVLRSVTGAHVKDARIQDIKIEILNSEKLKVRAYSQSI
jgi:ATP-dependent RNA helicase DDX56/DBP9